MSAREEGEGIAPASLEGGAGEGDPVLDGNEVDALEAKLAIDPGDESAFPLLAEAYRQDGRADEARRVAEAGVLARPGSAHGRIALALALLDQGDAEAAHQALLRGLAKGEDTRSPLLLPEAGEAVAEVAVVPVPDAIEDAELDAAFAAAESVVDEMRDVNAVAQEAMAVGALDAPEGLLLGMPEPGDADREGGFEAAIAISGGFAASSGWGREGTLQAGSLDPEAEARQLRLIITLESWLENIRRMTA